MSCVFCPTHCHLCHPPQIHSNKRSTVLHSAALGVCLHTVLLRQVHNMTAVVCVDETRLRCIRIYTSPARLLEVCKCMCDRQCNFAIYRVCLSVLPTTVCVCVRACVRVIMYQAGRPSFAFRLNQKYRHVPVKGKLRPACHNTLHSLIP